MKLFEVEKARMESHTSHAALLKPKVLSHQDIDALSMRLESLTSDYEILYQSKEESLLRARLEAIETRHGLMSLESDLTLRTESLGEWISSMIQKVLDAIKRFFDWIFGSGDEEEKIEDALEHSEEAEKKAEKAKNDQVKTKDGETVKLADVPVSTSSLRSHLNLAGQTADSVSKQIRLIALSTFALKTLVQGLSNMSDDTDGKNIAALLKLIGKAKETPEGAPEADYVASYRSDGFKFTVIGASKSDKGYTLVKTVLNISDQTGEVPETFTMYDFNKKVVPSLNHLGRFYSDLIQSSKKVLEKNEKEYTEALKGDKTQDLKPVVLRARLSLLLIEAVRSYSWVPGTIKAVAKALDKVTDSATKKDKSIIDQIKDPNVKVIEI